MELFLNPWMICPKFFRWDRTRRRATVVFVYAQGVTLIDPRGRVARTRQLAEEIVALGPPLPDSRTVAPRPLWC